MRCAAVRQFVPIDAGDNGVLHTKSLNCFANVTRFIGVKRNRPSLADRAEAAMPRADVAKNHEGRSALAPAFEDVWAASLLTHGVQAQVVDHSIHVVECIVRTNSDLEPVWSRACEFRLGHSMP